jgi:hypothetical protein
VDAWAWVKSPERNREAGILGVLRFAQDDIWLGNM